jgi:hypothetical protein
MATVNRFSPIVQPTVFNPISIEQFSMVPLARAEAKTNALLAASSYTMKYNVDSKDEAVVSSMVGNIHKTKDDIVNRIAKEGVSDNFVNDFIELRQTYQQTQNKVKVAEQNKAAIDQWKEQVFKIHHKNTAYMNLVLDKEYQKGWAGSFNEDGSTNAFQKSTGPMSYSIVDDFTQALSGISQETKQLIVGGARFKKEKMPDGSSAVVMVTSEGKTISSNKDDVLAKLTAVLQEYEDPTSERGSFKDYVGYTDDYIAAMGSKVAESVIKETVMDGGYRKSVVKDLGGGENDAPPPTGDPITGRNDITITTFNNTDKVLKPDNTSSNPGVSRVVSHTKNILTTVWNIFKSGFNSTGAIVESVINMDKINEKYRKDKTVDVDAVKEDLAEGFWEDYLRSKEEFDFTGVKKQMTPTEKFYDEEVEDFKKKALENKWLNADGSLTKEGKLEYYDEVVVPRIKNDLSGHTEEYPFYNQEFKESPLATVFPKGTPEGIYADIGNQMFGGENLDKGGSNIPVMGLTSKKPITDMETLVGLQQALLNYKKSTTAGEYSITPIGVGAANPKVYLSNSGGDVKFERNLVYGNAVVLKQKNTTGEEEVVGQYIIGNTKQFLENETIKRSVDKLETMAYMNPGEHKEIGYTVTGSNGKPTTVQGSVVLLAHDKPGTKGAYSNPKDKVAISKNNYAIELYDDNGNVINRFPYTVNELSNIDFVD